MKVLLVDDNPERAAKIGEHLIKGDGEVSFLHAQSVVDARTVLSTQLVDLLLLDVLIPNRAGEEPSAENSVRLLTEIADVGRLIKPRRIVGLTAYKEAAASVSEVFAQQTWTVLDAPEVSEAWLETLQACVRYLQLEARERARETYKTDLLILTALDDPEMDAVRRHTWNWSPPEPLDDLTFVSRTEIEIEGKTYSAVAAIADRMGMVATAILASNLFHTLRPRVCIMPGICAGLPRKTELGDVLFAEFCWNYQSGKHSVDDLQSSIFEIDPHQLDVDPSVAPRIRELARDTSFFSRVWTEFKTRNAKVPRLLLGPVATGSSVLADSSVVRDVQRQQRKVNGIEMELYGLYAAARLGPAPRPVVFGLKAVCDFADESKGDGFQEYAAYTSARVLREVVQRYLPEWVAREA